MLLNYLKKEKESFQEGCRALKALPFLDLGTYSLSR